VGAGGTSQAVWIGGTHPTFNAPTPNISSSQASLDFDFLAARTALQNLSSNTLEHYAGATTGTPVTNGTNYVLTASGSGMLVYNVDASYFTNQNLAFEVDLVSGQSVIINITGAPSTFTFAKGTVVKYNGTTVTANTTGGVPVLFNIPEVSSLATSNGSINGSILAPFAAFSSPNQTIDGQLFVASVSGLAETHDQYYNGLLPSFSTATPEPLSFLLLGTGLMALGLIGKRSR
jgi:choice-of-anchor A domain-containing protein